MKPKSYLEQLVDALLDPEQEEMSLKGLFYELEEINEQYKREERRRRMEERRRDRRDRYRTMGPITPQEAAFDPKIRVKLIPSGLIIEKPKYKNEKDHDFEIPEVSKIGWSIKYNKKENISNRT